MDLASILEALRQNLPDLSDLQAFASQDDFVHAITSLHWGWGIALVVFGVAYLLYGWKLFKFLVTLNAGVVGIMAGMYIGGHAAGWVTHYAGAANVPGWMNDPNLSLYVGGGLGMLLALLAWPALKMVVALSGAGVGGLLGWSAWLYVVSISSQPAFGSYAWIGGIVGAVAGVLLAFFLFRMVIIVFTSIQGSLMTLAGIAALVSLHPPYQQAIRDEITRSIHILPAVVAVPALVGMVFQTVKYLGGKKKKKDEE